MEAFCAGRAFTDSRHDPRVRMGLIATASVAPCHYTTTTTTKTMLETLSFLTEMRTSSHAIFLWSFEVSGRARDKVVAALISRLTDCPRCRRVHDGVLDSRGNIVS